MVKKLVFFSALFMTSTVFGVDTDYFSSEQFRRDLDGSYSFHLSFPLQVKSDEPFRSELAIKTLRQTYAWAIAKRAELRKIVAAGNKGYDEELRKLSALVPALDAYRERYLGFWRHVDDHPYLVTIAGACLALYGAAYVQGWLSPPNTARSSRSRR